MMIALGMSKLFGDCDCIKQRCKRLVHIACTDKDVVPVMSLTVVFIVGSGMYYKAEPQGNIMLDVCKCIGVSLVYTIHINTFCIHV